ncbi:MAG: 2-oxoacid:acceptor oxidoreductase family protein [Hyphomicrobiales bacterium]
MIDEVLIAGFGGQGIMLMGRLLAYGAIYEGLEVTFYPSYGPEMRGGTANCTVVIADSRIGSPVRNRFTHLMAMNQASVDKFGERVKPGGVIVYNQSLVEQAPVREDVTRVGVPANRIAAELQAPQAANMAAMGGLVGMLQRISPASLIKGLERVLPRHRHETIALNEAAIRSGIEAVARAMAHG